jgi:hypothetical protein
MKGNDMNSTDTARPSRRNFVIGAAAAGMATLFPSLRSSAQNNANPWRIDVHHHFEPDVYVAYRRSHNQGGPNAAWNVNKALDEMGKAGRRDFDLLDHAAGVLGGDRRTGTQSDPRNE